MKASRAVKHSFKPYAPLPKPGDPDFKWQRRQAPKTEEKGFSFGEMKQRKVSVENVERNHTAPAASWGNSLCNSISE